MKIETSKTELPCMSFYFKVNNSKLNKPKIMDRQVNKIIRRLIKKYNINYNGIVTLYMGLVDDDLIYNKFTLDISFNCD